ncbi:hypothetical protein HPC72_03260 [Actinomyces marmotae]|uniref:Uncharacterized protein n=1 Tax=Actinomyces marmotae TaxID=2737173 RepID=A0A6M8B7A2_9ACTO|nr:hypothetical protein HPC72_03260 [Actinomyces marmotae]
MERPDPPAAAPGDPEEADWAARRREAAAQRARMLRASRSAETARAERIVRAFLSAASAEGLEPVALRAKGYGGGSARTPLRGWYLRADRTVAIDVEGRFYILTRQLGLRDRLLGVCPSPDPVPLTIGEGGRDGDVVPLRFALDRLLPGWEGRSGTPLV